MARRRPDEVCPRVSPAALRATKAACAPIRSTPPVRRRRRSFEASEPAEAPEDAIAATTQRTSQASGFPGKASRPTIIEPPRRTNERRRVREAEPRLSQPPTTVAETSAAADAIAESRIAKPGGSRRTLML